MTPPILQAPVQAQAKLQRLRRKALKRPRLRLHHPRLPQPPNLRLALPLLVNENETLLQQLTKRKK